ncbi:DNA-binding protein WhiA [Lysinibacillus sphaericus]|uniref:Probable cell division protein WhiA n=4 Tax=Lysinibacillus TaxID=400634 RepID=A0A2S5CW95_LYSSH|nr:MULTISPECIES: DNA-binding protein WhiA [Lysinibacillus]AHN23154.1 sporulation regulator WhiA [Lysinibacillus varians]AVK95553.1 DNA-binding protein WhiA [Lysinibacillus sphaericus]MCS1384366.1 DNA-binding protein WhiA [Lysinibacillus sphaericus]MED4542793.1 DNA-binding protein WhiA [Lysinibacillus sphaericus]OEB99821.1 sporulation regulator WhiA [Lysinibacillus sphaericus]
MSFASETKKELTQVEADDYCMKAEVSALIRMNGSLSFANKQLSLDVQTENAAIARRLYTIMKKLYPYNVELLVRKKMRLKKNNVYICRVREGARELLINLAIISDDFQFNHTISKELIKKSGHKRAYLRGAFLAGGSVNNPETSAYHLEIYSLYKEHGEALMDLMNEFELNAKTIERKKGFVTYLKEAEKISDFLNIVGAHQAMMKFEDVRILRDMRNSVNRIVNCETANLNKTIGAALRQVENIRFIENSIGLDQLPEKLREIARLRVEYQDVTLKELGEMVSSGTVSKSGVNHRLRKIDEIADALRRGEKIGG